MAVGTPAQASFNGGELSPRILARIDQSMRSIGVRRMHGWLPLLQGPAEACPGTIFVAKAKAACALKTYEFNATQGYQIELGEFYARFYTNDVQIMDGGDPYEIETPWTLAQVRAMYTCQSLDALYCAVRSIGLKKIQRTSADTFEIVDHDLRNGPFEARNNDQAVTVSASATTGGITITASAALFEAGDVGGLMEIEAGSFSTIHSWEAGMTCANGNLCQSNGGVYLKTGGNNRTGTVPPIHIEGTEYDGLDGKDINDKGPYGAAWTFQYNLFGLIRFTGYTSATEMTATVLTPLASTAPCWRWRFGAFSTRRGFPEIVEIWQERLALAKDSSVYGSVSGGLDDFATRNELGDISRDESFRVDLPGADPVRWLHGDQSLVAGTSTAEHVLSAASAATGAGPGNIDRSEPEDNGSSAARPVKVNGRLVHIQRARSKVVQFAYDTNRLLRDESPNLSRFADHIGAVGLAEMAWIKEPERHMWFRRDDGTLAVMGYDANEQFLAWATRTLGGGVLATSISANTDPDGRFAQLWIAVEAGEEYWVLRMAPVRTSIDTGEQVMTDAAVRRTGAASALVQAPHLAGRTVDVCADGRPVMALALDEAGEATLPFEAEDVIAGLRFDAELEFLPPAGGSENGPSLGKAKRASRIDLHVLNSDELEVSCQGAVERINHLGRDAVFDAAVPLKSDRERVEPATDYDGDMAITVRRIWPRPSTVALVMPYFESAQA
jgi:hypothetical protein